VAFIDLMPVDYDWKLGDEMRWNGRKERRAQKAVQIYIS